MARIILVANRLPVTVRIEQDALDVRPSPGGLAMGLRAAHKHAESLWVGWPGEMPRLSAPRQRELDAMLASMSALPVYLNRREIGEYYEEIANGVLWPLFHYQVDQLPPLIQSWETYRAVNAKFAQHAAECYAPGDLIWVHDFHLALVPAMLRRMLPDARIGFFLHIPFPSPEMFAVLPARVEFLEGLMGADLIGFHTTAYVRQFAAALRLYLGVDASFDGARFGDRRVRFGAFPMGVDARRWSEHAAEPDVLADAAAIRQGAEHVLVGIDRLDYTKGILRRLLAFERLLEQHAEFRGKARFVQVTVPSREKIKAYADLRRRVDELVGRINSAYATPTTAPIHRIHRTLEEREVAALYRAADVMLVTPLRDGMNLVAKEFVAARNDDDGVLVLSEFAGAGAELGEALHVNPFDVDGFTATVHRALTMPPAERRARMRTLRGRVFTHDVVAWTDRYLAALKATDRHGHAPTPGDARSLLGIVRRGRDHPMLLVLDYDGTLVPFAPHPDDAVPDAPLLALLRGIASRTRTRIFVVSGRTRPSLERWLGDLPIGLQAEHGLWSRGPGDPQWQRTMSFDNAWKERVRPVLEHFTETTAGSFIEDKTQSIAWHYRSASGDHTDGLDFGEYQARELRCVLDELLRGEPLGVLNGNKVIGVRPHGLHKGVGVPLLMVGACADEMIVAMGDDSTDEDLFRALPDGSVTVRVGDGPTRALYRVQSYEDARQILAALIE